MPVVINMENCQFYDNASVIRYNNEINESQKQLSTLQQTQEIKEMVVALDELKAAIKQSDRITVKKIVTDFAVQFSSNLFASIAGTALKNLVGGILF